MRATGVGSMPGDDLAETLKVVRGELDDLLFVPELPDRGVQAAMVGRSLVLLEGLSADLQPTGWRLADGAGVDQRRARSLIGHDLDVLEEHWHDHEGALKQQVTGPWTLAASVQLPRGERVLADHGARRDLAESLAAGIGEHVAALRRRVPAADVVVQVDEPALPAVLAAQVPTASGFGRHRTIHPPEADAALRAVVEAVRAAGATPVVHSCAPEVPVGLLAGAGFAAVGFDALLVPPSDDWAAALEGGTDLWPGVVPALQEVGEKRVREDVRAWFGRLGFDVGELGDRVVLTPSCGLAGAGPGWARRALALLTRVAAESAHTT